MEASPMRVDLLEVRDARYEPSPWYSFVLLDVDANEAVGFFKSRAKAETQMVAWLEDDEEARKPDGWPEKCGSCGASWEHIGFDHADGFNCRACGRCDSDE